jgi:hypothetical protein
MMHVPWRCLDSICHAVASANQEAIFDFGWSLLKTREAKLTGTEEIGSS